MKKKFDAKVMAKSLKTFWNEPPKGRFLNLKEILCLGAGSFGVSCISNVVQIYVTISKLPKLYDMGPNGQLHATIIYIIACVLGLVFTPIYGKMIQKTNTKWGRYKPYILFLAPLVSIFAVLSAGGPQIDGITATTIYVYCVATPAIFLWNLWFNSWNMFPGVYSPNQQERTDIWSPIGLVMGFAPTIMNAMVPIISGLTGNELGTARIFSIVCILLGMVSLLGLLKVKERVLVTESESNSEKVSVIQGLKMVSKNKPLLIFTLALCLGCLKGAVDMIWEIYYTVQCGNTANVGYAVFGAVSVIVGFAATPNMILLPLLTRKFNNRTILIGWQCCNVGAYLLLALVGVDTVPQGTWSAVMVTIIRFIAMLNAIGSLQPLMLSEIADYQQWKTGYRLEGFIQTFAYSLVLLVSQVAFLIPSIIQSKLGMNPNDYLVQNDGGTVIIEEAKRQVALQYTQITLWISVISSALMLICLIFYPLSKKKHAQIVEELKAKSVNTEEIESEQGEGILMHVEEEIADAEANIEAEITENNENTSEEKDASEDNDAQLCEQECCDRENCDKENK